MHENNENKEKLSEEINDSQNINSSKESPVFESFENFENFDNADDEKNIEANDEVAEKNQDQDMIEISSSSNVEQVSDNEFENIGFDINFDEKIEDIMSDSSMTGGKREYEDISSSSISTDDSKKGGRKKLSKGKKALLITGISLVSIVLVIAILATYFLGFRYKYHYDKKFTVPVEQIDENIINIALFGVDTRETTTFSGNADSIMILSINKKTNKIKIISIMRDTFVPIKDENNNFKKYAKINAAYASGGSDVTKSAQYAVNTLNSVYGLDIANYAVINFSGMAKIIDAVGGITATITPDELDWKGHDHPNLNGCMEEICRKEGLNVNDYYIKKSGEQQLNGIQAVAYARVRHCESVWKTNNDYGRTDRQRYVMQQLFNKATQMSATKYDPLITELIKISQTSLGVDEILNLATSVLLKNPTFEQYRLPQEMEISVQKYSPMFNRFGWILYYDINYAQKLVKGIIYEDLTMDDAVKKYPIEKNKWYTGPDAGTMATPESIPPDVDDAPIIDQPVTPPGGDGTDTPPDDGTTPPDDGTTPPDDGTTPPDDGTTPPDDGTTPPDDGTTPPDDGTTPPDDGTSTPDDDTTPPDDGTTPPDDGTTPPDDGTSTPDDGAATPDDTTQGDLNTTRRR